jgi:hypothetical protein
MAKRTAFTPTTSGIAAIADTTNLVDSQYLAALRGASSTQVTRIWEVVVSGQVSAASAPMELPLAYDSTVSAGTATGVTDNPVDPATAALGAPVVTANAFATTKPQRAAGGKVMDCSINGYGGKFKWTAYDASFCPVMLGNAASTGEISLSCRAGTPGALSSHIIYETQ